MMPNFPSGIQHRMAFTSECLILIAEAGSERDREREINEFIKYSHIPHVLNYHLSVLHNYVLSSSVLEAKSKIVFTFE